MKQENYIKGMVMIILSAFFFACMNVSVRLAGDLPSFQKSFFRNLVAVVFCSSDPFERPRSTKSEKTILGTFVSSLCFWHNWNPL